LSGPFTAADWETDVIVAAVNASIVIYDINLREIRRFAFAHGRVHHLNWFTPTELLIGYLMSGQASRSTIAFLDPTSAKAFPLLMTSSSENDRASDFPISLCDCASDFRGEYGFYTIFFPSW
jgi:hypothetical protein